MISHEVWSCHIVQNTYAYLNWGILRYIVYIYKFLFRRGVGVVSLNYFCDSTTLLYCCVLYCEEWNITYVEMCVSHLFYI